MARTPRDLRGWGLHDSRVCFDNLEDNDGDTGHTSSYSQTAGRPGTPVAVDPLGTFRPHVHHAQEQDITVVALRAGLPGAADGGAGLGYRVLGETDEETRGWNEPNLVLGYQPIDFTTVENWAGADAVTCPRTQRVVVAATDSTLTTGVSVWRWSPVTGVWSAPEEIDSDLPSTSHQCCLTVLRETGRILLFNLKIGTLEAAVAQVYSSDDDGATWELYAEPELIQFADPDIERVRMVEDGNGNLLLLGIDQATGDYWQFASTDAGASFQLVETGSALAIGASMSVTATGRIVIAFVGTASFTFSITLDDAFDLISGKTPAVMNGDTTESVACATDADGVIYVAITTASSDVVQLARSVDDGGTFELYSRDLLATGGSIAAPTTHRHAVHALAPSGGGLVGVFRSQHTVTTPTTDGSLLALTLGGWGNVEAPTGNPSTYAFASRDRVSWADADDQDLNGIFLPTDTLVNQGWTETGTPQTIAAGYHRFAAVAGTSFATLTFAGHSTTPTAVMFEVEVVAGGDVANDDLCFLYVRRDGSDECRLRIRFAETGFRVRDDDSVSPSNLGTVTVDMTAGVYQFLILSGHKITKGRYTTVLYRLQGSALWIQAAQAELESIVTATTTDQVRLGIVSNATGEIRFGMVAWSETAVINKWLTALEDVSNFTTRLRWGKRMGPRPYPVLDQVDADANMLHLSASGGTARLQERWQAAAEWDHGARDLHPVESPKPTAGWRSLDTAEQIFVWDFGTDSWLGSSWCWFAAFVGVNFYTAQVEASTDADPDTWEVLGAYDGFTDTGTAFAGVPFDRTGDIVRPGTGAAGSRFYAKGEVTGGTIIMDPSGTPKLRRIVWNSPGWARDSGLQATFQIQGLDGTEPTSGVMYVVASGGVLVMPQPDPPVAYRRYRLRITEQDTADGHFRLGKFVMGSVTVVGRQWSRGWSVRYVPIVRDEVDDSGTSYVDARGSTVSGSVYREHTFSWQDGYDETLIRDGTAPYLSAGASKPALAADQDVHGQLQGLVRESLAGAIPSVVLLEIPATVSTITDRSMWSYGRLRGTPQFNNVQGDERTSQVYRGEQLVHVELV